MIRRASKQSNKGPKKSWMENTSHNIYGMITKIYIILRYDIINDDKMISQGVTFRDNRILYEVGVATCK